MWPRGSRTWKGSGAGGVAAVPSPAVVSLAFPLPLSLPLSSSLPLSLPAFFSWSDVSLFLSVSSFLLVLSSLLLSWVSSVSPSPGGSVFGGPGGVDSGTVISVPVTEWSPVSDPSGATELRSLSEPSSCPGAGKLPVEGFASRGTPEPGQRGAVAASVVREVGRAGGAEDSTSAVAGDR